MARRGRGRGRGRGGFDQNQQRNNQSGGGFNQNQRNNQGRGNFRGQSGQHNPRHQSGNQPDNRQHSYQRHAQNQKHPRHQHGQHQNQYSNLDYHDNPFQSQNQVRKTVQCGRCEKIGHTESACTAKEISLDSRCPCGNTFHYLSQCPFEGDIYKRDDEKARNEGKVCTWCKDTGDGQHIFDECHKAIEFRLALRRIQRDAYDVLEFCWHCGRLEHRTKACTSAQAQLDKDLWTARVTEVMEEWKGYSNTTLRTAYLDNELDHQMSNARDRRLPPSAASYWWCIYCEVFGHATGEKVGGCNMAKYELRCPIERRTLVAAARPFVPNGYQVPSNQVDSGLVRPGARYSTCSTAGCKKMVGPWTWPVPAMGQFIACPNCGTTNSHPGFQQTSQSSQQALFQGFGNLAREIAAGAMLVAQTSSNKPRSKSTVLRQEMYLKRPSLKLPWVLAHPQKLGLVGSPGTHTYRYTDGSRQGTWSPVLWEDGLYFNANWQGGGNFQEYFPAITFQITPQMRADSDNAALPINRVGRQGLLPKCTGCHAPIVVLDDEDDVVMCNTAWTNTLGEGKGTGYYRRMDGTRDPNQCECLWLVGQRGVIGWEDGRTGIQVG